MVILESMSLGSRSCYSTSPESLELGQSELPCLPILIQLQPDGVQVDDVNVHEVAEEILVKGDVELPIILFAEQPLLCPT